jgi:hypothetical protein
MEVSKNNTSYQERNKNENTFLLLLPLFSGLMAG